MRRAFYAVLLTGLFLLMLSALVVTPDLPDAPPMRTPADFHAMFRPVVSAILPAEADVLPARPNLRVILSVLPVPVICAALFWGVRDANGRVLTAVRYENSVYQVFRPEVAGG